jgi:hypothetical protein
MIVYPSPVGQEVDVDNLLHSIGETVRRVGPETEMEASGLDCSDYQGLVQQAWEVLIQDRAFSTDEAHRYLCELAQAGKLFLVEVAGRIVRDEWTWT